jgi:hypothetical protein
LFDPPGKKLRHEHPDLLSSSGQTAASGLKDRFEGHPNQALRGLTLRNPASNRFLRSAPFAPEAPETFPRLKVAFLEGTVAGSLVALPHRRILGDARAMHDIPLETKPSANISSRQCFASVDGDEALVKNVIDYMGDDKYRHLD